MLKWLARVTARWRMMSGLGDGWATAERCHGQSQSAPQVVDSGIAHRPMHAFSLAFTESSGLLLSCGFEVPAQSKAGGRVCRCLVCGFTTRAKHALLGYIYIVCTKMSLHVRLFRWWVPWVCCRTGTVHYYTAISPRIPVGLCSVDIRYCVDALIYETCLRRH